MKQNPRTQAAIILTQLVNRGISLSQLLPKIETNKEASLIKAFCYGVTRHYDQLNFIANQLLKKPFKEKDQDIQMLILIGLLQLIHLRTPDHAAISETVSATKALKKPWAKNVVNAVLRNFQRQKEKLLTSCEKNNVANYSHPRWLIEKIKNAYPENWQAILENNNQQAPMTLRVNLQMTSREKYLATVIQQLDHGAGAAFENPIDSAIKLQGDTEGGANFVEETDQLPKTAIILKKPIPATDLPNFNKGHCSVQDAAAQLAATLLNIKPNQSILDACAAPGGKATHILEVEPTTHLTAIDCDQDRVKKIHENLQRLNQQATVICDDVINTKSWWDKKSFDCILLDAPCSATGVIRRHPDIKLLRRESDIKQLAQTQLNMLNVLWPLLKKEGLLLYATCSILPEENDKVIETFLQQEKSAKEIAINANWGSPKKHGRQILPAENFMDGFYYCLLQKTG